MNRFLLAFLLLVSLVSCTKKYKIEGMTSIPRLDGKMLFLKVLGENDMITIDSAEVIHGNFSMKGEVDSIVMAMLYIGEQHIMPIVLENGKMKILITNTEQKAEGTPLNDRLYTFINKKNILEGQLEELRRKEAKMIMNGEDPVNIQAKLIEETERLSCKMNDYIKTFIIENSDNVLGPSLFIMLCSSFSYPVMTPQLEEIVNGSSSSFKTNRLVQEYVSKAKENMKLIQEDHADSPMNY